MLVVVAALQTCILWSSDTALNKAADAANDANKLNAIGLRPWVDFDLVNIDEGIVVTRYTVKFEIKYSLKNTGQLPAIMTNVNFAIKPIMLNGQDFARILAEEQAKVCKRTEFQNGNTVFPGKSPPTPYSITKIVPRSQFDSTPYNSVLITGCVGYQLAITGKYGHTGVALGISSIGGLPLSLPLQGVIRPEGLSKLRLPAEVAD